MESHTGLELSVRQPWADAIMAGRKTEEYRSQPTNLRGRIYIYASLGGAPADGDGHVRGAVIGEVTLAGCRDDGDRYAWLLEAPRRWDEALAPFQRANPVWFRTCIIISGRAEKPKATNLKVSERHQIAWYT